ncbi:hypothetical protein D1007_20244 [Hordeum vulgare]|nr:hypothetical protein D1007_20244 [Hordeum vulgare]
MRQPPGKPGAPRIVPAGPWLPCLCVVNPGSGAAASWARHDKLATVRAVDLASRPRGRWDPIVVAAGGGFCGVRIRIGGKFTVPLTIQPQPATSVSTVDPLLMQRWCPAMEYNFVGLNFKARTMTEKGIICCILDLKLHNGGGMLEFPVLNIDNETWRLLHNLMLLE